MADPVCARICHNPKLHAVAAELRRVWCSMIAGETPIWRVATRSIACDFAIHCLRFNVSNSPP
jgi:hypothetical protein